MPRPLHAALIIGGMTAALFYVVGPALQFSLRCTAGAAQEWHLA